jgi:glutaredoxin
MARRTTLYTRRNCHLCDDALAVLQQHGLEPTIVDIDQHPEFVSEFGNCVPVVEIDGQVRFRGRVNQLLLKRLLKN